MAYPIADTSAPARDTAAPPALPPLDRVALGVVLAKLLLHLVVAFVTPYEFHRDEFLYFAMGTHLRLFQMDFPPMTALLSEAVRNTVGTSMAGFRFVSGAAGAAVMLLGVLAAREMGGGRRAQVLTALAILVSPMFLRTATLFQPVVLDQLWWGLGLFALLRLERTGEPRWWLVVGVAAGLGLLAKFSILFFGAGVVIAVLLSRRRRDLLTPIPWLAALLALVIGAPTIAGQVALGFPVVDQMAGLRQTQLQRVTLGEVALDHVLWGPPGFLLAVTGAAALLFRPAMARCRFAGLAAVASLALFVLSNGKSYYVGPIHPVLFAAGAVALGRMPWQGVRGVLAWGGVVVALAWGMLVLPFGLPIVPPEPMARYAAALGLTTGVRTNRGELLPLPQDYADMMGWKEKAEAVAEVYRSLSPAEQANAVLYGNNYGLAGALELYGRRLGLPPVVSLAGSFYHFGPGERPGRVLILLGVEREDLDDLRCGQLEAPMRIKSPWAVPEEQDVPILVCRNPSMTLQEIWRANGPEWG